MTHMTRRRSTNAPVRVGRAALLLCCLLLTAAAAAASAFAVLPVDALPKVSLPRDTPPKDSLPRESLPRDSVYQLPLQLIDRNGRSFDWRRSRGQPQVVTMFYTSCPSMCPLIVDAGKAIEKSLTPAQRSDLHLLFISMDPARDTPAALMSLAKKRQLDITRWTLASPQPQAVPATAGVLGVRYRKLADGEFNHTSALILLDGNGRITARSNQVGSVPDPQFLAAVRQAVAQPPPSPLAHPTETTR